MANLIEQSQGMGVFLEGVPIFQTSNTYTFTGVVTFSGESANDTAVIVTNALQVSGVTDNSNSIYAGASSSILQTLTIVANDTSQTTQQDQLNLYANNDQDVGIAIIHGSTGVQTIRFDNGGNLGAFQIGDQSSKPLLVKTSNITLDDGSGTMTTQGRKQNITPKSTGSPYTAVAADDVISVTTGAGGYTVNLPAATGTGRRIIVIKADNGAGAVTVTPNGADTIEGGANKSLANQYKKCALIDYASAVWLDLAANLI